ncbi:YaiI/YqxD family protein [Mycoplasmatota bacterium zrk1]
MRILVDADACPVKETIIEVAKLSEIKVIMYFDTSHIYENDYAKTVIVPKGVNAVDMKLVSDTLSDDICITNDYGLATLLLARGLKVIGFSGLVYTNDNIDTLLHSRYISGKERARGSRLKGPKRRSKNDDVLFKKKLIEVINESKLYRC